MHRLMMTAVVAFLVSVPASGQTWAKARLEKSPRHQEWVKVKQGHREVSSFVVYPESKDKTPAVVVIHEIFGLTDWVKGVADQLAEAGYIAIAPDLLSGTGKEPTEDVQAAIKNVSALPPNQVTADLNAVTEYVSKLPACNGRVAVCGFCWGGSQTFRFATNNRDIKAAYVFYGGSPSKEEDIERIQCPVYGFYAENDARVNATVPKAEEWMKKAGKTYEPVTYKGAGHGFMRDGEAPNGKDANKEAREEAWKRWKELLKRI